jgi:hypothetical protein
MSQEVPLGDVSLLVQVTCILERDVFKQEFRKHDHDMHFEGLFMS